LKYANCRQLSNPGGADAAGGIVERRSTVFPESRRAGIDIETDKKD